MGCETRWEFLPGRIQSEWEVLGVRTLFRRLFARPTTVKWIVHYWLGRLSMSTLRSIGLEAKTHKRVNLRAISRVFGFNRNQGAICISWWVDIEEDLQTIALKSGVEVPSMLLKISVGTFSREAVKRPLQLSTTGYIISIVRVLREDTRWGSLLHKLLAQSKFPSKKLS